jgi:ATP synthase protein I
VQQNWKDVGRYGTVGLELALSILVGLFAGRWLDAKLGSAPWLTLTGLGFGLAAAIRTLYRAVQAANRAAEQAEAEQKGSRDAYHAKKNSPKGPSSS